MILRRLALVAAFGAALTATPALADRQAVGPPTTVNGVRNVAPPIVKDGIKYYPANVVAEYIGAQMEWDPVTHKVYANGHEVDFEILLVGETLYLAYEPTVVVDGTTEQPPGPEGHDQHQGPPVWQTAVEARRHRIDEMMPDDPGDIARDYRVPVKSDVPLHPWSTGSGGPAVVAHTPASPTVPAHLQPGAAPVQGPVQPQSLPATLPPPGSPPPGQTHPQVIVPSVSTGPATGAPRVVTTQGGPIDASAPPDQVVALNADPYRQPRDYTAPAPPPRAPAVFEPVSGANDLFHVSVQGLNQTSSFEGVVPAPQGKKYVVVSVAQKNLSHVLQVEPGNFALRDTNGKRHAHDQRLSQIEPISLAPGDVNVGRLVFEIPSDVQPARIELEGTLPLKIDLY